MEIIGILSINIKAIRIRSMIIIINDSLTLQIISIRVYGKSCTSSYTYIFQGRWIVSFMHEIESNIIVVFFLLKMDLGVEYTVWIPISSPYIRFYFFVHFEFNIHIEAEKKAISEEERKDHR